MPVPSHTTAAAAASYQPLVVVLVAACGGIVLDRWWPAPLGVWIVAAAVAWLGWCYAWRRAWLATSAVALLVSVAGTAGAWHHCRWQLFAGDDARVFARAEAKPAALRARAVSAPRRVPAPPPNPLATIPTGERTRLDVELTAVRDGDTWRPAAGNISLMVDGQLLGVEPGDDVELFGQLAAIAPPANPGEFDFAAHSRGERRLCSVRCEFPECVSTLEHGSVWNWRRAIAALRGGGDALLWQRLAGQRRGLAAAMFLGERDELETDLSQAFLETGTIHLLVVSGLNVGILAGCLFFAMRVLLVPRAWALAVVAGACLLYAATTDSEPPVVRATVMVLVGCLAAVIGRRPLGFNSLAAAGLVVLAINPAELVQSGTQLSFLSVAVLAWLAETRTPKTIDPLDRLIARTRPWPQRYVRWIGSWLYTTSLVSLAVWLAIAPLVMARFHLVSPVAVLLGPLLAVPVGLAMASGFGIFALGGLIPPLARVLGLVCDTSLYSMQVCVDVSRHLPGGYFWVPGPSDWWLAGFYALTIGWMLWGHGRVPRRWAVALVAAWIAVGLSLTWARPRDEGQLTCTFLSVGHGAAVVVELPDGQTLLYDAGRLGSPTRASRAIAGYLWSRGITHLDAVVISHADADHYNALPAVLQQFSAGAVYVSPVMFLEPSRALDALRSSIDSSGTSLREVWGGDQLRVGGGARIEVMHPPRRGVLGSDNANSIVLAIEFAGRRLLLTGDLESPGLDDLLAEEPYDCDVVLAPHHGSAFSDPPEFARWTTPEFAVVSGGPQDNPAAMAGAYDAVGAQIVHTARSGAVTVSVNDGRLDVRTWQAGVE